MIVCQSAAQIQLHPTMSQKHYLNNVVCAAAPDSQFAQDAVLHAIQMDHVKLTWTDLEYDLDLIMAEFDAILENYRVEVARNAEVLADSYEPLLNEIRRAA
jgi:hypothetical protein